ncbi:MAG: hypothetical protein Q7S66_00615 [bacterium]|nr:hypothetical protein [bacterium]
MMDNIVELHQALVNGTYRHGGYESFYINDPKRRHIHKASVRDRLLHHAVYRILYPFFDRTADKQWLVDVIPRLTEFLQTNLKLSLHPDKIFLKTITSGVDFLGWVHFADHRVLRAKTKQRMFKKIRQTPTAASLQSYLGVLGHGNARNLRERLLGEYWLWGG